MGSVPPALLEHLPAPASCASDLTPRASREEPSSRVPRPAALSEEAPLRSRERAWMQPLLLALRAAPPLAASPGPSNGQGVWPGARIEARTRTARADSELSEKNGRPVPGVYSRAKEEARSGRFPWGAI